MCGRFSRAADMATLAKRFGINLAEIVEVRPRYNLAPSEETPAVVIEGGKRRIEILKWGLTRQWDKAKRPLFITNLTVEKLAKGPFKSVLAERRCLIPADGFYEWQGVPGKKQPYRFTLKDESLFAFPAIYDELQNIESRISNIESSNSQFAIRNSKLRTFTIFTTPANALVAKVHTRMPAILPPDLEDAWLEPKLTEIQKVVSMLQPYPPDKMKSWAVSPVLNSAKIDAPELIQPI